MAAILAGQDIKAADFDGAGDDFEATADTSSSTTYVAGTQHGDSFVAPISGSVNIDYGGLLGSNHTVITLAALMTIRVRTGSTVAAGTDVLAAADAQAVRYYKPFTAASYHYGQVGRRYRLTGLTPGDSYNVVTEFRAVASSTTVAQRWLTVESANA